MEGIGGYTFGGTHTLTLDDKGRLTVPAPLRKELGDEVVVRRNPQERCVEILPPSVWNLYLAELQRLPKLDRKAQRFRNLETAGAVYTSLDRQGRVLVPAEMKEMAGLGAGQVVITGSIDRLMVWSADRWAQLQDEAEEEDLAGYVYEKFQL